MTSGNNKTALLEISSHPQSHNPTPPAHVTEPKPSTRLTSSWKKTSPTFPLKLETTGESLSLNQLLEQNAFLLPHTWTFAVKILG